ncbi:hypothetical protein FQN54_007648 [Arachnomyces sp. PD_36]|nr:hypothetical protein FQN54_007648 [Arachnomyces sp. PD_36]
MSQFDPSGPVKYSTFEDFFVRKYEAGSRPTHEVDRPSRAVIKANSRVVIYPIVDVARRLWVKGYQFTIANLVGDADATKPWDNGMVARSRLSS